MLMTQYMSLLMANAPYNLITFMVVPMVIAETIAITEIVLLFRTKPLLNLQRLNSVCSFAAGIVMLILGGLFIKDLVIPANNENLWKGWIDYASAVCFLIAVIPLVLMSLLQINIIFRKASKRSKMAAKIVLLSVYLVVSHAAMVFGMLDPSLCMTDNTQLIKEETNVNHKHAMPMIMSSEHANMPSMDQKKAADSNYEMSSHEMNK